jgi:hypothetical protein
MPEPIVSFDILVYGSTVRTFRDREYLAIDAGRQLAGRVLAEIGRQLTRSADGDVADQQGFSRP